MRGLDGIEVIGVVGAGTMGAGIAQVAAIHGYEVIVRDVERQLVKEGINQIERGIERAIDREQIAVDSQDGVLDRINGTTDLHDLADVDFVIEAVVEEMDVKQSVFGSLEEIVDSDVILATNTSTLSITAIAGATDTPGRVVGLHFMNPVPVMEGVEVIVGERTADEVRDIAHSLAEALEKTTWEADDKPGFVTNRILMPWINEGIRAYDEGVATREDIDRGMKLGTNVPMGPLELADHIGLDVCLHASETLHAELGDRYKPAYLLQRKVAAGLLGKKTGEGFYQYD